MSLQHQFRRTLWSMSALALVGLFLGSHAKLVRADADAVLLAQCATPPVAETPREPLPAARVLQWRQLLPATMPVIRAK